LELMCSVCRVQGCRHEPGTQPYPAFCPMANGHDEALQRARAWYDDSRTLQLALAAARTEAAGYCRWPRVQEIMDFARRIGASHLGVAHCVGLVQEADVLRKILEGNGFQVSTVCCKVGSVSKGGMGLLDDEKIHPGAFEALCNPVGQAELLKEAGTELNIAVGLCVGHDSLFFQHSHAPVTVLVAKDRVTGHNPVAALYTSHSYYRRLKADG
jgi:uncharacterized metal-binding protein